MDSLRAHVGVTSAVAGAIFAVLVFVLGGGQPDAVGFGLAAMLGVVFGVSMYASARMRSRRSN